MLSILCAVLLAVAPASSPTASQPAPRANPYADLPRYNQSMSVRIASWQYSVTSCRWADQAQDPSEASNRLRQRQYSQIAADETAGIAIDPNVYKSLGSWLQPSKGMLFLNLGVSAKNLGQDAASPKKVMLVDAQGQAYDRDPLANGPHQPIPLINAQQETGMGGIWQLRPNALYSIVLLDEQGKPQATITLRPERLPPKPRVQVNHNARGQTR